MLTDKQKVIRLQNIIEQMVEVERQDRKQIADLNIKYNIARKQNKDLRKKINTIKKWLANVEFLNTNK